MTAGARIPPTGNESDSVGEGKSGMWDGLRGCAQQRMKQAE